jgi:SAM-dependent methyltransferase
MAFTRKALPTPGIAAARMQASRMPAKAIYWGMDNNDLRADQRTYWDRVASTKQFTIPIDFEMLASYMPPSSRILDLGCGYGRVCAELWSRGYRQVVGIDTSAGMIARGRTEQPHLDLRVQADRRLPFEDAWFDAVLLVAVLTCVPDDDQQRAMMSEVRRVLRPGGILCLSDYPLQTDTRNLERYARDASRFGTYGVFELPEGVVVRHHTPARFDELTGEYERIQRRELDILTMNGHSARAVQMLLRRPLASGSGQVGIGPGNAVKH